MRTPSARLRLGAPLLVLLAATPGTAQTPSPYNPTTVPPAVAPSPRPAKTPEPRPDPTPLPPSPLVGEGRGGGVNRATIGGTPPHPNPPPPGGRGPENAAPTASPKPAEASPIRLAAQCLERGDDAGALAHLEGYVAAHPEHLAIRAYLAELLTKMNRPAEARRHFERYVADAQAERAVGGQHLIHCHSRLMELARSAGDAYGEHLHRGIGLFLLARQMTETCEDNGGPAAQTLFCQAAGELTQAQQARPDEARPHWYLYEVWSRTGQSQPAARSLRLARAAAPFTFLTPVERQDLAAVTFADRWSGR